MLPLVCESMKENDFKPNEHSDRRKQSTRGLEGIGGAELIGQDAMRWDGMEKVDKEMSESNGSLLMSMLSVYSHTHAQQKFG